MSVGVEISSPICGGISFRLASDSINFMFPLVENAVARFVGQQSEFMIKNHEREREWSVELPTKSSTNTLQAEKSSLAKREIKNHSKAFPLTTLTSFPKLFFNPKAGA